MNMQHIWVEHAFLILTLIIDLINIMSIMNKRVCKDGIFSIHFIIKQFDTWHPAVCNFMPCCFHHFYFFLYFFAAVFWEDLIYLFICKGRHLSWFAHPVIPPHYFHSCKKYKDFEAEWASVFHMHRKLMVIYSYFIQISTDLSTFGYYTSSTVILHYSTVIS